MADQLIELAVGIVAAFVERNQVTGDSLPGLITDVHAALVATREPEGPPPPPRPRSAAKVQASIRPDALISFLDGRPYRTLKRHLGTQGLTPAQYREQFGLPADYPMTAPNYSAARSEIAKKLGLGNKAGAKGKARARR